MAPKAEKKPAKKVAKKVAGGKGKKGKSKVESFKIYIYKVLKQVKHIQKARNRTQHRRPTQAFSVRRIFYASLRSYVLHDCKHGLRSAFGI